MLALAKAVANATASLVLKAKAVASTTDDPVQSDRVISSATQCALATSQLVACTKVMLELETARKKLDKRWDKMKVGSEGQNYISF